MRIIIAFIVSLISYELFALEISLEIQRRVVIRDKNYDAHIQKVKLTDLTSETSYEGKFFKIINGKGNQAVRFDDHEDLQLRAATTYYHLTKARKYFIEVAKSDYVAKMPQVTVRIELTNVFNEIGHFANDNLNPQYNNALTIPAGKGYAPKNIPPWGIEIWFRPAKEINIVDLTGSASVGGVKNALVDFRNQSHMSNLRQFFIELFSMNSSQNTGDPAYYMRLAGSSVLIEFIYQTSEIAAEFFSRKIYRLDSALVPEIIYHEYAHAALSNHFGLTHSTPVNEGMADYFAGKIADSKKLALNIKDYNLFDGKKVKKKQQYNLAFERGEFANTDFVFGLLWAIGKTVGHEIEIPFMTRVTTKMSTNGNIREDLINASLEACKEICTTPLIDRIKLYKMFHKKNI